MATNPGSQKNILRTTKTLRSNFYLFNPILFLRLGQYSAVLLILHQTVQAAIDRSSAVQRSFIRKIHSPSSARKFFNPISHLNFNDLEISYERSIEGRRAGEFILSIVYFQKQRSPIYNNLTFYVFLLLSLEIFLPVIKIRS